MHRYTLFKKKSQMIIWLCTNVWTFTGWMIHFEVSERAKKKKTLVISLFLFILFHLIWIQFRQIGCVDWCGVVSTFLKGFKSDFKSSKETEKSLLHAIEFSLRYRYFDLIYIELGPINKKNLDRKNQWNKTTKCAECGYFLFSFERYIRAIWRWLICSLAFFCSEKTATD